MADLKVITTKDLDRALLLVPIVMEIGVEAAKRLVSGGILTDDDLVTEAQNFQADTRRRLEEFENRLQNV